MGGAPSTGGGGAPGTGGAPVAGASGAGTVVSTPIYGGRPAAAPTRNGGGAGAGGGAPGSAAEPGGAGDHPAPVATVHVPGLADRAGCGCSVGGEPGRPTGLGLVLGLALVFFRIAVLRRRSSAVPSVRPPSRR